MVPGQSLQVDVLILNHVVGFYEDWGARIMRGHSGGSLDADLAFVDKIFQVNLLSYVYISSYALPALAATGGRIIAVGSAAGRQGLPRVAPYSASKHAVFGYFDSLRQDLVASEDPGLRGVSITTGVLGSFDTETAREGTYSARTYTSTLFLVGSRAPVHYHISRRLALPPPLPPRFLSPTPVVGPYISFVSRSKLKLKFTSLCTTTTTSFRMSRGAGCHF